MRSPSIDSPSQKFYKYLTYFYIIMMCLICLAAMPIMTIVLFFQTLGKGEKR
jgi:hypothetical protein